MPQLLTSLNHFPSDLMGGAVSVGNFDGIHRGHAALIGELVAAAERVAGPAIVLTFNPPPAALLYPKRPLPPPLTTIERRAELLFDLGVNALIAYPLDQGLLSLSAEQFFHQKLLEVMQVQMVVEGPNFRFGRNREGDIIQLRAMCDAARIGFLAVHEITAGASMISSTRIRQLLTAGDVIQANAMLTQPYTLQGLVVQGAQRGRGLGFPTANLEHIESLIPGPGVYAGRAFLPKESLPAAINIGPNPTFAESRTKVEVHIINYHGPSLYGQPLRIAVTEKIRDVKQFESTDALREQVAHDVAECALRS